MEITEEQRDIMDAQIREEIKQKVGKKSSGNFLPVSAMINARMSLGLGLDLENACPYIRDCEFKTPQLSISPNYRGCSLYKVRLVGDILSNELKLEGKVK